MCGLSVTTGFEFADQFQKGFPLFGDGGAGVDLHEHRKGQKPDARPIISQSRFEGIVINKRSKDTSEMNGGSLIGTFEEVTKVVKEVDGEFILSQPLDVVDLTFRFRNVGKGFRPLLPDLISESNDFGVFGDLLIGGRGHTRDQSRQGSEQTHGGVNGER